jgi:hypothetical protein
VNCSFFTLIPFLDCSIKTTCPSLRNYAITGDTGREVLAQYDFRGDATREGCMYSAHYAFRGHALRTRIQLVMDKTSNSGHFGHCCFDS